MISYSKFSYLHKPFPQTISSSISVAKLWSKSADLVCWLDSLAFERKILLQGGKGGEADPVRCNLPGSGGALHKCLLPVALQSH